MKFFFLFLVLGLVGCSREPSSIRAFSAGSAIVGGEILPQNTFPAISTVQIFKISGKEKTISSCTGNVIASHLILTAAHCMASGREKNFVFFSTQIPANFFTFFKADVHNENLRQVIASVTASPWSEDQVKPLKNWQDLAILKFEGELPTGYAPVALENADVINQQNILIAGFGVVDGVNGTSSTDLRATQVPVQDSQWSETEVLLDTSHGHSSCHGDSGGPAYAAIDGQWVLVGIDSRSELKSDPDSECTGNTIYTRIDPYLGWLQAQVQNLN